MAAGYASSILWAQWRTFRNSYSRLGMAWGAVIGVIWYGVWTFLAFVISIVVASPVNAQPAATQLPGLLLLIVLYWQLIPLLLAASGASLDLRKLRVYPIPGPPLFGVEVLLRVTAAVEVFVVLMGVSIGIVRNPQMHWWGMLALLPFVAFNLTLGVGIRDVIARLLARRGIREAAFFVLILCAALPQILLTRGSGFLSRISAILGHEAWYGWPWTATTHLIQNFDVVRSGGILTLWLTAAVLFGYTQFIRTMSFDTQAASARETGPTARSSLLERIYRLPGRFLSDPMGALVEKEFRFLSRSPRFRLVFLMGFTFGLLVWLPVALGRQGNSQSFLRGNYLTVISVYSLLLLSEVCFWNSFGFDRSAAQIYFLAPISFRRVLMAKNISALVFIVLEISIIALVCRILGMPLSLLGLAEAFAVAGVISIFLLSAGNHFSIRQARGSNPAASFRTGGAKRVQAILFVVYPVASVPIGLAYLARYAFSSEAAFFGVLAFDVGVGAVIYKLALDSAAQTAERLKERMIEALSRGDGPIAS